MKVEKLNKTKIKELAFFKHGVDRAWDLAYFQEHRDRKATWVWVLEQPVSSFFYALRWAAFKGEIWDTGPYWAWREPDGCHIRVVKESHWFSGEWKDLGFGQACFLPYHYDRENRILTVTADEGVWGWQTPVSLPIRMAALEP